MAIFRNPAEDKGPVFGKPEWTSLDDEASHELAHSASSGHQSPFTRSRIFAALQALGAPDDAPAPAHAPDWTSMPQPRFSGLLDPHIGQPQLMPAPPWMQPYLWGGR